MKNQDSYICIFTAFLAIQAVLFPSSQRDAHMPWEQKDLSPSLICCQNSTSIPRAPCGITTPGKNI